jgi:Ca2+/Na+ antiporter
MVRNLCIEQLQYQYLGLANGHFCCNHLPNRIIDYAICPRRRGNNGYIPCGKYRVVKGFRIVYGQKTLAQTLSFSAFLGHHLNTAQVPIALYGFVVAATWIDAIADKLVALLEFLGVTLRIPNSIMGLTILAWGNSMADLSANVTMARKGLANMALTACFAGPLFNILIGLGAGFGLLRSIKKTEIIYVSLTPDISTGFVFCFANCILILLSGLAFNKGVIPAGYGYLAIGMYAVYVVTSLVLNYALPESA